MSDEQQRQDIPVALTATQDAPTAAAVVEPCRQCCGIGMVYRPGLAADIEDGFDEHMDECAACTGDRFCPKCGGEMYYPVDLDPEEEDDETDTCERCGFVWDGEARHAASYEAKARIMCPEHPRWREFIDRLVGPEGCNFREQGGLHGWNCSGEDDRPFCRAILVAMGGIDAEGTLRYFDVHGGHCDCEVVFNVDPDENDEEE